MIRRPRKPGAGRVAALSLVGALGMLLLAPLVGVTAAQAKASDPGQADGDPDIAITVTVPDRTTTPDGPFTVSDASLRWGLDAEAGSGAFFGGCNFLVAGRPGTDGNTHGGAVWSDDRYYHATAGAVRVEKPDAHGVYQAATFGSRCAAPDGRTVSTANGLSTGTQAVVSGGRGTVDPVAGTATIRWKGTFTSVFYGGLTYWWATDPVLTVRADGTGSLTATAGGYGTSMDDQSQWDALPATTVVLADLARVPLTGAKGFRVVPRYVGTAVTVPAGGTAQATRTSANSAYWGSFPQSFVDFQAKTGQLSYWFTSGGQRDPFKVAAPLYVSFDADAPVAVDPGDTPTTGGSGSGPVNTVTNAPPATGPASSAGSGSAGSGPAGSGSSTGTGDASSAYPPGTAPVTPSGLGGAAPASLVGPTSPAAGLPDVASDTGAAATVGARSALVPTLGAPSSSGGDALAAATTGLLLAASGAVYGFRKGWLVPPFLG